MNKDRFNRHCAEVMGYKPDGKGGFTNLVGRYTPYDDLNQMAEVFDRLMSGDGFVMMKFSTYDCTKEPPLKIDIPIAEGMRQYIISTMPEDKK